jgi:hypothetical protein
VAGEGNAGAVLPGGRVPARARWRASGRGVPPGHRGRRADPAGGLRRHARRAAPGRSSSAPRIGSACSIPIPVAGSPLRCRELAERVHDRVLAERDEIRRGLGAHS